MASKEKVNRADIKTSMLECINGSLILLSQKPLPDGNAIHDIRVMMKKQRAAVRLVKPLLDEPVYNREYLAGRETGRILSSWRESNVLRKTMKALRKDHPELFTKLWDNETVQNLLRKPYATWEQAGVQAKTVSKVTEQLTRAGYRIRFLSLNELDFRMLLGEVEQSYLAAARAYLDCRNNTKPRLLHEFRKKSKTLMYQLDFFRHLNPAAVKSLEKRLDIMTRNLGKYNDLDQILTILGYKYRDSANSDVNDELAVVIKDRQDSYLMKVWPAAYRIFMPGKKLQDLLDISF
jgi:CHAD domain-containing protein